MRRILLALLLALALSPGLLWRNGRPTPNHSQSLTLAPLAFPKDAHVGGKAGPLLTGAWQLNSPNTGFGSYSALVATGANELLAISDRGQFLRFPMPGAQGKAALGTVLEGSDPYKTMQDMESVTRDPATGRLWIGLEFQQAILRLDADFTRPQPVKPEPMADWRYNGGAESLVRLADGRFVVLSESPPRGQSRGSARVGVVFPGDPVDGGAPVEFRFVPPAGFDPSDMAQLPDGRVLILLRGLKFFLPGFTARLAIADPAAIRAGEEWPWQDIGALQPPIPIDNYEGLAVTGGANGGPVTLWLVSDDNDSLVIQRTLLLRFAWQVPVRAGQ